MLKVSSHVISLASPVFRAMLRSTFLEGAKTISSEERQIVLPDDHVETVELFCNIIHLQDDGRTRPSFPLFEDLSVFCDKYDAAVALMPWSTLCFVDHFSLSYKPLPFIRKESESQQDCAVRFLYIAFAFRNVTGFAKASVHLFRGWNDSTRSRLEEYEGQHVPLPEGLLGKHPCYQIRNALTD